ncbi:flavin reductase family protein [Undibacterium cyanobacteriorum]|uniref:Flavin reductase family protein n=1 Tax=Undibacterium cyanobacteriorum TaxID=3073561 RepID=A0ABY9RN09_9BURK|nr:flavin reductase family protein [Undibacterium sp. 20NA77.5]WMW81670.1 flavin reductase family protein [Undibacterium sp. 20NA77.5]
MQKSQLTDLPSALAPDFDPRQFRNALAQFATGVTIITTKLSDGRFIGLTANSFNSVSLDPPLVLWSLGNRAQSLPVFQQNSHYVINVLTADQQALAEQFASRAEDRFEGVEFELSRTGLPILKGVAAWFECHNRSQYPEGDHVILVGEVERCAYNEQSADTQNRPLIFHNGRFLT